MFVWTSPPIHWFAYIQIEARIEALGHVHHQAVLQSIQPSSILHFARQVQLPPGYFVTWGGQFENQQKAMARLAVVVPLVIGLRFTNSI